jgi:predicted amino acid-binding ACT domain protein
MSSTIRRVDYFYTTVQDRPGQAYELLTHLATLGVNLLGLNLIPMGPDATQMTIFPHDSHALVSAAQKARIELNGPHRALLVQGDDELGALAEVFALLADSEVNVYASHAVADGKGHYGNIIYVRPEHYDKAVKALRV